MKNILFIILFFGELKSIAQVKWNETLNWKIYKIPDQIIFRVSIDSLNQLKNYQLNQDSVIRYLGAADILPDSLNPIWMGGWVATYEYKGQTRKMQISAYGGFFYDQTSRRYYQIPIDRKEEWMNYINHSLSSLTNTP